MMNLSSVERTGIVEALKDLKEWNTFVEEIEQVVIAEIKEHRASPWWSIMLEIVINASTKCSAAGLDAIRDSSLIPQECKDASIADWTAFAVTVLVDQGRIISSIWDKPATPAV